MRSWLRNVFDALYARVWNIPSADKGYTVLSRANSLTVYLHMHNARTIFLLA